MLPFNSDLNKQYPISLKHINHIIDRVADRYPALNKHQILFIIKTFIETIRTLLLAGEVIKLNNLMPNMRLISYVRYIKGKYTLTTKVKISTPRKMKNV